MKSESDKVSDRLKLALEGDSRSLHEITFKSNVCQTSVRKFLDGKMDLSLRTVDKLARVLGVNLFYLEADDDTTEGENDAG